MKFLTKSVALFVSLAGCTTFVSCNEDANIGSSLVGIEGTITVSDEFELQGVNVPIGAVQSRTVMQLIGDIDAVGYGKFRSDFVTQFMPATALDSTLTDVNQIDGIRLVLMYSAGQFVGDSIVPMGLDVYRLNKSLVAPIYSDIDPSDYYNPEDKLGSQSYTAANIELSDSLAALSYREIFVDLPKSLGVELFELYKNNPSVYNNPYLFCDKFKGVYVKNTFGKGRVTKVGATALEMLYHYDTKTSEGNDTTYHYTKSYYVVTPEIVTNNNISYTMSDMLQQRIDNGENLIVAPAGQELEVTFPIHDVIDFYLSNKSKLAVLNDLTFSIPSEKIINDYGINPPGYILMVLKNKKTEFFDKSKLTDNQTSFYAQYNTTTGEYNFGSMRKYLIEMLEKDEISADDYIFTITPVSIGFESYNSSNVMTSITPYIEQPAMVKLNLDKAKIVLTFSNQQLKN